jgi:hypothetical protein
MSRHKANVTEKVSTLGCRSTERFVKRFDAEARDRGVKRSDLVRTVLEREIDRAPVDAYIIAEIRAHREAVLNSLLDFAAAFGKSPLFNVDTVKARIAQADKTKLQKAIDTLNGMRD